MSNTELIISTTDLRDKIVDRIKSSFVELIPDDAWNVLVQTEIDNLSRPAVDGYNRTLNYSPLQKMIREEIEAILKKKIKETLAGFGGSWGQHGFEPNEVLSKVIEKSAPALVKAAIANIVNEACQAISDRM